MARRSRLDFDGFHHIINRGVERNNIYKGYVSIKGWHSQIKKTRMTAIG